MSGGRAEGKGKKKKKGRRWRQELRSLLSLRHAALHLQHFGPSLELVGVCAVLNVLEERKKKKKNKSSQALFFWSCWTSPSWKGRTVCFSLLRRVTQNRVGLIRTCRDQEPTRAGESHWLHEVSHCFTARKSYLQPGWRSHQRIPTLSPLNFY